MVFFLNLNALKKSMNTSLKNKHEGSLKCNFSGKQCSTFLKQVQCVLVITQFMQLCTVYTCM